MNNIDAGMKGKHVLITGAGRGLGAAFAVVFADMGAEVCLAGRDPEALNEIVKAIAARTGVKPETVKLDLADTQSVIQLVAHWRRDGRGLDILINNGAKWQSGSFDCSDEELVTLVNANVTGTMLLTKGLLPVLQASPAGDVVNIVSVSGIQHAPQQTASVAYMTTKAAQSGFTDALRQELRGSGIRVTAIYPPYLEDISPLDTERWNAPREKTAWVSNGDVVEAVMSALQRGLHVSFQSILLESTNSNFHFHKEAQ